MEGKAKVAFEKWLISDIDENDNRSGTQVYVRLMIFENYKQNLKNTLIIEWLDSIGIYIFVDPQSSSENNNWWRYHISSFSLDSNIKESDFETRTEATNKAIEKAVEIYDTLNK